MLPWNKALEQLDGAFSEHTLRTYQSSFKQFSIWCRRGRVTALPAAPDTVAQYLKAEGVRLKPSTLKHRLCAIRKIHQVCEFGDPTSHAVVEMAMRRVRRPQPSRPRQALGIPAPLRDRLLEAATGDLIGIRDKLLISIGFDTLCRRGELVALSIQDLSPNEDGRYVILVRRAKNDPEGAGRLCLISTQSSQLVDLWLTATGAEKGPLLRPVYRNRALALYLAPLTVARVLKKLSSRAGIADPASQSVSGHSLRVGAAQQLALNGRSLLQIMRIGGWRSPTVVARYIEHLDIDVWE